LPFKPVTLGACLLLASICFSQTQNYKVRSGDTVETISRKFRVSQRDILRANRLDNPNKLQIGQTLKIPGVAAPAQQSRSTQPSRPTQQNASSQPSSTANTYTVKSGDTDWVIARRFGLRVSDLHSMNPSVDWRRLQIGAVVKVSAARSAAQRPAAQSAAASNARAAAPSSASSSTASPSKSFVTARDGVVIRRTPSANGAKIRTVGAGIEVKPLETRSGWYKVRFPQGTVGWVQSNQIVAGTAGPARVAQKDTPKVGLASTGASAAELVSNARSFEGVRYRYGGMSRSGTDCSGFTVQVFGSMGVKLPRTSAEQSKVGVPVDKGQLKKGDLVFFRTARSSRINHVGIYVGAGKFIHASSGSGRVLESSLSEGYYLRCYATARRISKFDASVLNTIVAEPEKPIEDDGEEIESNPPSQSTGAAGVGTAGVGAGGTINSLRRLMP
jgi:cell wall-associated NlpC family hydrolase